MNKSVRVSLSELQVNWLMRLTSMELLRQITHNSVDPVLGEAAMRIVKAKEKFMPGGKETMNEAKGTEGENGTSINS